MPRKVSDVNAGSMADIAFLLLIFFLVTTTIETDSGINRKLPPMDQLDDPPEIKERNIFEVVVNKYNQLLVEENLTELDDLRGLAIEFLDNGAGEDEEACDYCQGNRDPSSSVNPDRAVISLKNDRETSYKVYIAVQNELVGAYNDLRNREFVRLFPQESMTYVEAQNTYDDPRTDLDTREALKPKLDQVKQMFPQKLSEAEPSKANRN
ncbi:MAG: biopolymer transporter ExbD [Flavobacteriaceae bacterium]|nr:biopolymer transporter ExbD [Flavobacteriaceae bacterium]MCY4268081.1 biopolymer transporter ExbD [Flavobacteriaceae bacterium]MCY4298567.1 biopolymer transporter ExbD [Flavobacteriaceae bacterium]